MRFFGATFFLEVEVDVTSVIEGLFQCMGMKDPEIPPTNGMYSRWTCFLVLRATGLVHVHRCLLSLSEQCLRAR